MTKKRKRLMHILGLIALGVTALWIVGILWQIDDWSRDWTQNHASISPNARDPRLISPVYSESPDAISIRLTAWAQAQAHWSVVSHKNEAGVITLHLLRTTPFLRFTDDIHVKLEPIDGGTRLTAESQSRLGKGDLGQNPRNLKALLDGLREKVTARDSVTHNAEHQRRLE